MTNYKSRREASNRWNRENTRQYTIKCWTKTDIDIIDYLDSLDNKNGYIKGLIRADIAAGPAAGPSGNDPSQDHTNSVSDPVGDPVSE